MSTVIGENIKKLRRERKITQEALALHLGLSCQAVSKWERGDSLPDISMIVPMANFFRVSADEILGVTVARRESDIEGYLKEYTALDATDDVAAKYALVKKAYTEYPDDFRIIKLYTEYLCADPAVEDGFAAHKLELQRACRHILEECGIESIRYYAMDLLSQLHYLDNEDEQAVAVLSGFPSAFQTKHQMISMLFESGSDIRLTHSRCALAETLENLLIQIRHIALEDTSFNRVDQLGYLRRAIGVIEQLIPDGDFGFFHYHMSDFCFWLANRYVMTENPDAAMDQLQLAFTHAKSYDALPEEYTYTTPLLRGYTVSRADRGRAGHEKKVESQMTYLEETCAHLYAPLMRRPDMQKLMDSLKEH
ncbi:MAG: helix-turn-helix transcriptional regulator [Clostridia bacterium]|nr:helix-turn-helix transcriptional regulator [Clostridia bacterium]